jgi:hypothetical protein
MRATDKVVGQRVRSPGDPSASFADAMTGGGIEVEKQTRGIVQPNTRASVPSQPRRHGLRPAAGGNAASRRAAASRGVACAARGAAAAGRFVGQQGRRQGGLCVWRPGQVGCWLPGTSCLSGGLDLVSGLQLHQILAIGCVCYPVWPFQGLHNRSRPLLLGMPLSCRGAVLNSDLRAALQHDVEASLSAAAVARAAHSAAHAERCRQGCRAAGSSGGGCGSSDADGDARRGRDSGNGVRQDEARAASGRAHRGGNSWVATSAGSAGPAGLVAASDGGGGEQSVSKGPVPARPFAGSLAWR